MTRIGYATLNDDWSRPDARRRFRHYASRRGMTVEVARPGGSYDIVVATAGSDLGIWSRLPRGPRLVLDVVDAYLDVPRADWKGLARGVAKFAMGHTRGLHLDFRGLLLEACRRADAIVCATEEQRARLAARHPNVHAVLDFQPEADQVKTDYRRGDAFHLVWEGLPQNVAPFRVVAGALARVARRVPVVVHLITALQRPRVSTHLFPEPTERLVRRALPGLDVRLHAWDIDTFARTAVPNDLAIIPLVLDDPFAAGKPENKLVLFWRMAMPVVTSATPAYRRTMAAAGLDLACVSEDDWVRQLERLADDEEARRDAGVRGRAFALAEHGEDRLLERWDAVFRSLGRETPAGGLNAGT